MQRRENLKMLNAEKIMVISLGHSIIFATLSLSLSLWY